MLQMGWLDFQPSAANGRRWRCFAWKIRLTCTLYNPNYSNNRIKTGTATVSTDVAPITVTGLGSRYRLLCVFCYPGEGQTYSKNAYIYKFHTENIVKPIFRVAYNPSVTFALTAKQLYLLLVVQTVAACR